MIVEPKRRGRGRGAAPKTQSEVTADVVQLALRSRFNPVRGITPQILSSQLDNFHLGFIAFAALTWDAIERRDDVLRNVISKRKKSVARLKRESLQREESSEAAAHAEALDEFYDNLSVTNALDENERGGFPLLVRQMMDAQGKYYAAHEVVWQPEGDVLTAELRFVPLWFFENRTGRLRFLRVPLGGSEGDALEDGGWMVTKGDGLMEACSIAWMFKNLPLKDWLAYSDKFGTPGVLGQTNAAKGSEAGDAMKEAVAQFGQNWSGTVYGADGTIKEPISLITAGSGASTLPFPPLIERMDRAMAALWRGSDLSTMSADTKGASVQDGEGDILLEDDAALISDTLNHYLDRWVIRQKFGTDTPLAYSRLIVPQQENVELDLKVDELLLKAGARLGENERLEHYGRPRIDAKDTPLKLAAQPSAIGNQPPGEPPSSFANAAAQHGASDLIAKAVQTIGAGVALDTRPVLARLAAVYALPDAEFGAGIREFANQLPGLATLVSNSPQTQRAFYEALSAALLTGLTGGERAELANAFDESKHPRVPKGQKGGGEFGHSGTGRAKGDRRASYKPMSRERLHRGLAEEAKVAKAVGGENLPDNEPFDVIVGNHALEVKTIIDGTTDRVIINKSSRLRKEKFARQTGKKIHTVAIDARRQPPSYYIREGVGAYSLSSMTRVKSLGALKEALR